MMTRTALLSFGALSASLLLFGCGSGSRPAAPAAAATAPPPALPAPTQYDAEAFFATTSYIMPAGYAWSADDKQLLVTSDETGIYNVYGLPAAGEGKQALTSSTADSTFGIAASAVRCALVATPPDAITGKGEREASAAVAATFGPAPMPSRATSV